MNKKDKFYPDWTTGSPPQGSYRSIFKWGSQDGYKHPNNSLYEELKLTFNVTDADFYEKKTTGYEPVKIKKPIKLTKAQITKLTKIAGLENIFSSDYDRVKYATGKTMEEAMKLRQGKVERVADLIIHPRDKKVILEIVKYCNAQKIPIYVYGGGSSVNFGFRPSKGGITLVMNTYMNQIIELNEDNHSVTVQAGMMGPDFEDALNNAQKIFNAKRSYTCGHFPQSFEFSSVGGWVVTLGSGQCSSYYGDACDLVLSQEYITPTGIIKTLDYAATATGPKISDIMTGSEGSFGILVELKMKIFRHMPHNRQRFSFMFPSWENAVNACRDISQGEFGMPSVMRISDAEETNIGLKLYGIDGTIADKALRLFGYKPMQRCLFLGASDGDITFTKNVKKNVKKICRKYGGFNLGSLATRKWEPGRFKDPYLRESLQDYGVLIDTLESSVNWSGIHKLHQKVREFIKKRPATICMTHASHFYPQGTNLYFIFIVKMEDVNEYIKFQTAVLDAINDNGGSLSHHHGVGKMTGPWMEKHLGIEQMAVLRTLKKHFDPNNIMNPGGLLGLEKNIKDWRKVK